MFFDEINVQNTSFPTPPIQDIRTVAYPSPLAPEVISMQDGSGLIIDSFRMTSLK